ncbi:hypothetical protein QTI04_01270 [Variovorax sp. J22R115]|nr:hypothetical protein [Variovorax sp. J22R115]MDM0047624.1 hypothetical protein [Variovorax sp. J22R115]
MQSQQQRDAKVLLEMSDLMAQGRLRDAQFIRCALEAAVPPDGLERA